MPYENWILRYLEIGEQQYGTNTKNLTDGLKTSAVSEGINRVYEFIKQTNKDFDKPWEIGGKNFNHLTPKDIMYDKPRLELLEAALKHFSKSFDPTAYKPYHYYPNPDHLVQTIAPQGVEFKTGTLLSDSVQDAIKNFQWTNHFTYKQWREDLLPHVLKTQFNETLDKLQSELAEKLKKENKPIAEQQKELRQLALDLGADFEKYTDYLANKTEYLARPIKAFNTPETKASEKAEIEKLKNDTQLKLKDEDIKKIRNLYKKTKPVLTEAELTRKINERIQGVPLKTASEEKLRQNEKSEVKPPQNNEVKPEQTNEEKPEQKSEVKPEQKLPELPKDTPNWIAKAAGYDTRGYMQYFWDGIKNSTYNIAKTSGLNYAKDYINDLVKNWRSSKVICGKDFTPLEVSTRLTTWGIKQGGDFGIEKVEDYLKKYENYVIGEDVCDYALLGQMAPEEKLFVDLYNVSGVEIGCSDIDFDIMQMIRNSKWKDYFSQDQWREEIMPHLIKESYKMQLEKIQDSLLQRYNDEESLANKDILMQSMSKAAEKLGEIYEQYSLNMANKTDYLSAPLTMRKDEKFVEKTLEQFKDLPKINYDALKKSLTKKNSLFDPDKIEQSIRDKVKNVKEFEPEKCIRSIIRNKETAKRFNTQPTPDQETKDATRYLKGVLAIREMKKANEDRNFFRKYIFNGEYKRQKAAIADYEATLSKQFNYPESATKNLTDLKTPVEQGLTQADLLSIDYKVYTPDGYVKQTVKAGAKLLGQATVELIGATGKVFNYAGYALYETGKVLYDNSDKIINVLDEKSKPVIDVVKKAGGAVVNTVSNIGAGVVSGTKTIVNTGANIVVKTAQAVNTTVQTGVNVVKNVGQFGVNVVTGTYNTLYNAGSSIYNGITSFGSYLFGGSKQKSELEPSIGDDEENNQLEEIKEEAEKDEFEEAKEKIELVKENSQPEKTPEHTEKDPEVIQENKPEEIQDNQPEGIQKNQPEEIQKNQPEEIQSSENKELQQNAPVQNTDNEPDNDDEEVYEDPNETLVDDDKQPEETQQSQGYLSSAYNAVYNAGSSVLSGIGSLFSWGSNKTQEENQPSIGDEEEQPEEIDDNDEFEDAYTPEEYEQKFGDNGPALMLNSEAQVKWNKSFDDLYEKINRRLESYQNQIKNLDKFNQKTVMEGFAGITCCKNLIKSINMMRFENSKNQASDSELTDQLKTLSNISNSMDKESFKNNISDMALNDKALKQAVLFCGSKGNTLEALKATAENEITTDNFLKSYNDFKQESSLKEKQELEKAKTIEEKKMLEEQKLPESKETQIKEEDDYAWQIE